MLEDEITSKILSRKRGFMQENLEELKKEKKKRIHQIIVFVIAAIAVIIALCIAWFVSNTRVRGTGATVSADMKNVELKTHGSAGIHDDLLKKIMEKDGNSWYQKLTNASLRHLLINIP